MARFAVLSIFVVAVAVSGAYAGLIPDSPSPPTTTLPTPVPIPKIAEIPSVIPAPQTKADAIDLLNNGRGFGKRGINARISLFIASSNRDASLTSMSKKCIAEKSNRVRDDVLSGIDNTVDGIQNNIEAASDAWLPVWGEIIENLPNMILDVIITCQDSLNTAKSECIAQSATASAA